jgi:hypothetical protein
MSHKFYHVCADIEGLTSSVPEVRSPGAIIRQGVALQNSAGYWYGSAPEPWTYPETYMSPVTDIKVFRPHPP